MWQWASSHRAQPRWHGHMCSQQPRAGSNPRGPQSMCVQRKCRYSLSRVFREKSDSVPAANETLRIHTAMRSPLATSDVALCLSFTRPLVLNNLRLPMCSYESSFNAIADLWKWLYKQNLTIRPWNVKMKLSSNYSLTRRSSNHLKHSGYVYIPFKFTNKILIR